MLYRIKKRTKIVYHTCTNEKSFNAMHSSTKNYLYAYMLGGKRFYMKNSIIPEMFAACIINPLSYQTSEHTAMV